MYKRAKKLFWKFGLIVLLNHYAEMPFFFSFFLSFNAVWHQKTDAYQIKSKQLFQFLQMKLRYNC